MYDLLQQQFTKDMFTSHDTTYDRFTNCCTSLVTRVAARKRLERGKHLPSFTAPNTSHNALLSLLGPVKILKNYSVKKRSLRVNLAGFPVHKNVTCWMHKSHLHVVGKRSSMHLLLTNLILSDSKDCYHD